MLGAAARGVPKRRASARERALEDREFQDGDLVPGTRYRVLGVLGAGGMGRVYEVEHVELGKRFVLKVLIRALADRPDLVLRLRNEWRALARLDHPNIVNVTDAGTSGSGVPYFVMERLEGETLGARLARERRVAPRDAVKLLAMVVDGLAAAHSIGVVHRDVKPGNIFLVAGGSPKLLDFGVAKSADVVNVVTGRGVAVGTPRYMAPEQVKGERVDGRSDLYACGLVLFEMLTGVGPFDDARDSNELLLAHATRPPPRVSEFVMGVPPELDELLGELLCKDPRGRPEHASDVAARLRSLAALAGVGISSVRPLPLVLPEQSSATVTLERETRDATTKPEGVAAERARTNAPPETFTRTTVDPPLEPTVEQPRVRPVLPTTTLVDPLSERLTESVPGGVVFGRFTNTSRIGTMDPVVLSGAPDATPDTRTHVPVPVTPPDEAKSRPLAVATRTTPRGQGLMTASVVMLATVLSVSVAWKAMESPNAPAAPPPPAEVPAARAASGSARENPAEVPARESESVQTTPKPEVPKADIPAAPADSALARRPQRPREARRSPLSAPSASARGGMAVPPLRPGLPASGL
jgi:serine/threonine protein kinase